MAFWMVAFFLVPLVLILLYSFGTQSAYQTGVSLGFDTEWYRRIFTEPANRKAFLLTAEMVIGNTVGCVVIGYPLAYFVSAKSGRRKTLFLLLVMMPFWTSFLIRAYSWMTILGNGGLLNGWLNTLGIIDGPLNVMYTQKAVYLGLVYDYLPFMVLPLFVGIEKIEPALREASKDLGAGKWTTLAKVTLPLSLPGIFAGCMLTAVPTTGEFVIPQILGGSKVVVWGWLIYEEFTAGRNWPMGAALSNVLLLVMLVIIVAYIKTVGTEEF
ncbi:MAG TPA: ABC transporter permease [Thermoleophilia bacterium]|nr:ABC transporter permease [Thermoleophilia bacterium]